MSKCTRCGHHLGPLVVDLSVPEELHLQLPCHFLVQALARHVIEEFVGGHTTRPPHAGPPHSAR